MTRALLPLMPPEHVTNVETMVMVGQDIMELLQWLIKNTNMAL